MRVEGEVILMIEPYSLVEERQFFGTGYESTE
jgi:hypothetical protein